MRTIETMVTFRHPFVLTALETAQPAGTYRLVTEEEEIPGLSFVAFGRTATMLRRTAGVSRTLQRASQATRRRRRNSSFPDRFL